MSGCFLVPSPDDAWSNDYLRATDSADASDASDAPRRTTEAGLACAGQPSCFACCDRQFGADNGADFYLAIWRCICGAPDRLCGNDNCGTQCPSSVESSDRCLTCLQSNTKGTCAQTQIALSCAPGDACAGYADCMAGCEP